MTLAQRLDAYEQLMRLDKPIGILLLLWPTLWALWLSTPGQLRLDVLIIFLLGTVLMRSAGCIVNDFADRRFDPFVKRTQDRPLAAGRVGTTEALVLALVLALLAFALVAQLNWLTVCLSFAALAIAVIYPFLKRFFVFPQAGLGIAFSFGVPMAFAAQQGALPPQAWLMMAATAFWVLAYDTEYAMVDRDDDIRIGLHSSAILLGHRDVTAVMIFQAIFLAGMAGLGLLYRLGAFYYVGIAVATGFAVRQYWLIRERDRSKCFKAFLSNNWVGASIFIGLLFDLMMRGRGLSIGFM